MSSNNTQTPHRFRGRLGSYNLLRTLGIGGFGKVYLGEHIRLHSWAAVKVLHMNLIQEQAERFKHEAEIVAQLPSHPHVIRVLDYNIQNGRPYIVMDYAPYGNLRQLYSFGIKVPLRRVVSYVRQLATGLQHIHDFGVIHCDVKPENMFIGSQGEVLIGDFGIAVDLQEENPQSQDTFGTVAYMAPEQIRGHPQPASDQYGLAVVVYEWLTGQLPFTGDNKLEIAQKHLHAQPQSMRALNPAIPEAVELVVLKALNKDPAQRYPSITAFAHAFEKASRSGRSATIPPAIARGRRSSLHSPQHRTIHSIPHFLFFVLLILGLLALAILLTPVALVTITETSLIQTWGIDASSTIGSTNKIQNPFAAHTETSDTTSQMKTVPTTGMKHVSATQAHGEITLYNADVVSHFIPAGTTIAVPYSKLQIITDEDVIVPAGTLLQAGLVNVHVHIIQAGVDGNIAAGTLYGITCCSSANIHVNNMRAFIGGQDANTYPVVQQSDIDKTSTSLEASQQLSAPGLLQKQEEQAQPHEILVISSVQCIPVVDASTPVGSKATTVTVTVKSTCTGVFYNSEAVNAFVLPQFIDREDQRIGGMFILSGRPKVYITMTRVIPANKGLARLALHIVATGRWIFNFNIMQKQRLAQAIAGKKISDASSQLVQFIAKAGVNRVNIRFSWNYPGFAEDRLPPDTSRIMLKVVHQ